jgi:ribonuclease HI
MKVYTDGARIGSGAGGWGWWAEDGREDSGQELDTTNQRMEMMAVIEALRSIDVSEPLTIVSSKRQAVANQDLWEELVSLVSRRRNVTWEKVKGHSGIPGNEKADELATKAARR